jgi:hypothetical protein
VLVCRSMPKYEPDVVAKIRWAKRGELSSPHHSSLNHALNAYPSKYRVSVCCVVHINPKLTSSRSPTTTVLRQTSPRRTCIRSSIRSKPPATPSQSFFHTSSVHGSVKRILSAHPSSLLISGPVPSTMKMAQRTTCPEAVMVNQMTEVTNGF